LADTVIRKIIFLLFLFLTIFPQSPSAKDLDLIQTDEVTILFEKGLRIAAEDTANIYPMLKAELEKTLNWKLDFRPTILLTNSRRKFEELTGNSLVVAYAIPRKNLIVVDYSKTTTRPFSLGTILKHELCHLLLHHHIREVHLPRWLDEGISQWVSDGIAEIIINRKRSTLNTAVLSKRLIRLERLSVSFPRDEKSLLLAYEESKSVVEYIGNEFGRDGILNLLQHMRDGYEIDVAIQQSLSVRFDELERKWHSHLRKKITWFTYLATNLYTILFFLAALITVFGFVRVVIKKRRYGEDEPSS
jgi:hypothetical protein